MNEVVSYSKKQDCLLKMKDKNAIKNFSNIELFEQLSNSCPNLAGMLLSISKSGKPKMIEKLRDVNTPPIVRNGICAAAAICMKLYNEKLSAFHYRTGLLLLNGGVKALTLKRCYMLGLCVSHESCIRMQKKFGKDFDLKAVSWRQETEEKELMVRFLKELEFKQVNETGEKTEIDLSLGTVSSYSYFDETVYAKCSELLTSLKNKDETSKNTDCSDSHEHSTTLKTLRQAMTQIKSGIVHYK